MLYEINMWQLFNQYDSHIEFRSVNDWWSIYDLCTDKYIIWDMKNLKYHGETGDHYYEGF